MATYVLLHGGWGGGWEWRRVGELLSASGHDVYRPSYTGLGERRHLAAPSIGLGTHIEDVVGLFDSEELEDVILCGHSYSGMVLSDAADRLADRIQRLIFIDGFVPNDGESLLDLVPESLAQRIRDLAASDGDGWLVPLPFPTPKPGEAPAEVVAYFEKASCPMPLACFDTPIRLSTHIDPRSTESIRCTQVDEADLLGESAQRAAKRGWQISEVDAPHDVQFFAPELLADVLQR